MANPLRPQMSQPPQGPPPNPQPLGGPANLMQRLIFNKMYQSNPQFRAFADSMQGKSPEQAFQEQGLDYNQFRDINPNQIKQMLGL